METLRFMQENDRFRAVAGAQNGEIKVVKRRVLPARKPRFGVSFYSLEDELRLLLTASSWTFKR